VTSMGIQERTLWTIRLSGLLQFLALPDEMCPDEMITDGHRVDRVALSGSVLGLPAKAASTVAGLGYATLL
jgi:hypothetical protein